MASQMPSVYDHPQHRQPLAMTSGGKKYADPPASIADVRSLLCELRDLLDAYGPVWYEETHHDRIAAAVALLGHVKGESC
jgi:hypothetical protein